MKRIFLIASILFIAGCGSNTAEQPNNTTSQTDTPEVIKQVKLLYSGTLFVSPDILDNSDPSFFVSLEKIPDEQRRMFDRRNGMNESYSGGKWIEIVPFLFIAYFSDGQEIEVQVNKEFENVNTAKEVALPYLDAIGKLPSLFRKDVETIWLHKGTKGFGGGNNNLLIHHGRGLEYMKDGLLEEAFLHEASHTSLDREHASSKGWLAAVQADGGNFISDYAKEYPPGEDVAETFPICFAVQYKPESLKNGDIQKIKKTIPNRLAYCNKVFETYSMNKDITQPAATKLGNVAGREVYLRGYLHGYARSDSHQHGYGLSYYTGIWSTFETYQPDRYQRGHGTWITPNNENYDEPLCPTGTVARDNWPERAPSYRDVFQTIEGGPGYWGNTVFPDTQMKYRVNVITDCYTTQTSSPGWNWGGNNNLDNQAGLAQLSNTFLYPPDGITFERGANGDFLGQGWMILPLTDQDPQNISLGTNNWTLFLNAANFSGPTVYMTPQGWNRITENYPPAEGRALDTLTTNSTFRPLADEIGMTNAREAIIGAETYTQIPALMYPVDKKGRTIFHQDVKFYSKKSIYNDFLAHRNNGSSLTANRLDSQGYEIGKITDTDFGFRLDDKEIAGIDNIVETKTFSDTAWGFQWHDQSTSGIFPQYFSTRDIIKNGDSQTIQVAISEQDVPIEGREILVTSPPQKGGRDYAVNSYEPPAAGWPNPENDQTYTAKLIDGSVITYGWYRFIDQPAISKLNLNESQKASLQSIIESMHTMNWSTDNPVLSAPTFGSLVEIDKALIVQPPIGMEIGYVPVALSQR